MPATPRVSIVIPLFNDEVHVVAAIESCLSQSMSDVEIICIDDASTDRTPEIVDDYRRRDPRVRLIRNTANASAFQCRRTGVDAASAPYILFLDGDDELHPDAAEVALRKAHVSGADVVGFGVEIVAADNRMPRRFESALQPKFDTLLGAEIIPAIFPPGEAANGHLWRYLFSRTLLRMAYEGIPAEHAFYRANDLPIAFLALANAKKYVSTRERLYRYYFRRGTSGHLIDGVERFRFVLSGIDPIDSIAQAVGELATHCSHGEAIRRSYDSARLHMIGSALRNCVQETSGHLQQRCLSLLLERVGLLDLVRAGAGFYPESLGAVSRAAAALSLPPTGSARQSVLLHTAHLDTGGLQSVLLEQASVLADAGFSVTVIVLRDTERSINLPPGVTIEVLSGDPLARINRWIEICDERAIDVIVDHHILYNQHWPWLAMAALARGIPTIGWVHNFALRPLFDVSLRTSFLAAHMQLLWRVVTLSPTDVAFWKLMGVQDVVYLPNPLSPFARDVLSQPANRTLRDERIEIVWWGRLDGPTKQVLQLVATATELEKRGVDFTLKIIGPDSKNLSASRVREEIDARRLRDRVILIGERTSGDLVSEVSEAKLFLNTSAIEGAPLTLLEAQSLGLPVVMYDLPWLASNLLSDAVIRTSPDDPAELAEAVIGVMATPETYRELSQAARAAAESAALIDVADLTVRLLDGTLPAKYSPEPTLQDARLLVEWMVRIGERNAVTPGGPFGGGSQTYQRELSAMQRRLTSITQGPSFRVGRVVTYLPRLLRRAWRSGRR